MTAKAIWERRRVWYGIRVLIRIGNQVEIMPDPGDLEAAFAEEIRAFWRRARRFGKIAAGRVRVRT